MPSKSAYLPSPSRGAPSQPPRSFVTHLDLQRDYDTQVLTADTPPRDRESPNCLNCAAAQAGHRDVHNCQCHCCTGACEAEFTHLALDSRTSSNAGSAASSLKTTTLPARCDSTLTHEARSECSDDTGRTTPGDAPPVIDSDVYVQLQVRNSHEAWQSLRYVRRSASHQQPLQQQQQQQQQQPPRNHPRASGSRAQNRRGSFAQQPSAQQQPSAPMPMASAPPPPLPSFMMPRAAKPESTAAVPESPLVAYARRQR